MYSITTETKIAKEKEPRFKRLVYLTIHKPTAHFKPSIYYDYFNFVLITFNLLSIVLESFQELEKEYGVIFLVFEIFSVMIFSIEYIFDLWVSGMIYPKEKNRGRAAARFVFSVNGIIDLLSILPFYLPMILPFDLRFLRILRVMRMVRVLKLEKYLNSIKLISDVVKSKKKELIVSMFIMCLLILVSAITMHHIESKVQPKAFPNIVATMWWSVSTLTIGGDVYPVTAMGKILSCIITLLGIGMVGLPTAILSSGFLELIETKKEEAKPECCPHCGKRPDEKHTNIQTGPL